MQAKSSKKEPAKAKNKGNNFYGQSENRIFAADMHINALG